MHAHIYTYTHAHTHAFPVPLFIPGAPKLAQLLIFALLEECDPRRVILNLPLTLVACVFPAPAPGSLSWYSQPPLAMEVRELAAE